MESRLRTLLALSASNGTPDDVDMEDAVGQGQGEKEGNGAARKEDASQLPPGWRKLTERDGWRPAPIGVYVSCP
ncbi:hypothetical protein GY45DRAFT_1316295 [Cubamyces sp. BRFM 1775]|nr:hypothetical protein GY45DRAFT_1316295 [Cubamyces sp. BRFM 1775]